MLIVLDTNVIISAVLSPNGNSARIVRRWEAGEFEIATSTTLIKELEKALTYDREKKHIGLTTKDLEGLLKNLQSSTTFVEPEEFLDVVNEDPDDNHVIECAVTAKASYIITGDDHLLELKEYQGIVILTPAEFLTFLEIGKKANE